MTEKSSNIVGAARPRRSGPRLTRRAWLGAPVSLAMALAGISALGAGLAAPEARAEGEKVKVGALRFTSHAPTFIAYEKGYFADEGLDVELEFFQAAQPIAVAIASGDVDFGVTAMSGGLFSLADKGVIKVIGGLYSESPDRDGNAIMASNKAWDAGLKTPADIKGKTWGMTQQGSSFHYIAGLVADANGFDIKDVHVKPLQKVGAMIGALKSGQVDAISMVPHVAIPLEQAGAGHIIGWARDYGDYQITTIFTSTKNVEERPELVSRFLRAYARAIEDYAEAFLVDDPDPAKTDAMVELIHEYVYADKPLDKAAPGIKAGAVNLDITLNVEDVAKQLAWFKANRLAPQGLELDDFVDTTFVENLSN